MTDINDIDRDLIEQNIKTEAGFKQFAATRLWSIDENVKTINRLLSDHETRLLTIEDTQKQILTGWRTIKGICVLLWGVIVFIIGLLYKDR